MNDLALELAQPARRASSGKANSRSGAQTAHRALDILTTFSTDRPSQSLSEICESVGLTVPTTHRLLKALQTRDLVVWDPGSRRYSLGSGIMRLARVIVHRDDIAAIAQPGLEKLRNLTAETVGLHWKVGEMRVCILELPSPEPIRMASGVGRSYPLYAGAAGKAMLAWMPAGPRDRVLDEATPPRRRALAKELVNIRRLGYAMSVGETTKGAAAVATVLLDANNTVIGAFNLTGPADRFDLRRRKQAVKPLREMASEVMRRMGSTGGA